MHQRVSTFASTVLALAAFATIGCDSTSDMSTTSLTGPGPIAVGSLNAFAAASMTAEPAIVAAELQPSATCQTEAPFAARLTIIVRPTRNLFIRRFGFDFFDRFGRRALPLPFLESFQTDPGVVLPIPLPTTHPIPFPGEAKMSSVVAQSGGFVRFPFRLQFDCGVNPRGTLSISVETADERGTIDVSQIRAQIR